MLNINDGSGLKRTPLGEVEENDPITFTLVSAENGEIQFDIADQSFRLTSKPLTLGQSKVFCSTGQFKFADLEM